MHETRYPVDRKLHLRPYRLCGPPDASWKVNTARVMQSPFGLGRPNSRRREDKMGEVENGTDETAEHQDSSVLQT